VQRHAGFLITSPTSKVQEEKSIKWSWNENCTWNTAGLTILKIGTTLFMWVSGEAMSADSKPTSEWVKVFGYNVKKRYRKEDAYSAHANGLLYNMMPYITFKCRGEKCVGGLRPKHHSTVLMYMNMRRNKHTPTQKS
jgi:hypothetical protein